MTSYNTFPTPPNQYHYHRHVTPDGRLIVEVARKRSSSNSRCVVGGVFGVVFSFS